MRRLITLSARYRSDCLQVFGYQIVLLLLGVTGLGLTGLAIDVTRHALDPTTPEPRWPLGWHPPGSWAPGQALVAIGALVLAMAALRAGLNYAYNIAVGRLVHLEIVPELRTRVFDKLQRLSFRFFDENASGSIINRVTSDVQSVRSFVDERIETWKTRYPERAGDFKRRVATKLPAVDIDRRWVARALDEFADNAVKYTDPGSAITLGASLAEDGDGVRIAVRDAGAGFDPRRAAELVGDFSQADASETRRVGGLGLGLGFVSRVAARFGLPLSVETEPGKGSEFALELPVATGR